MWRMSNINLQNFGCNWDRNEIPNDFLWFPMTPNQMEVLSYKSRDADANLIKMAAAKPEVYLSQVVVEIETKFQMIFWGFQWRPTKWKCCFISRVTASSLHMKIPDGGLQGGSAALYLRCQSRYIENSNG